MNQGITQAQLSGQYHICAVIVTYNIGRRVLQTLDMLQSMVDGCIILDNGSTDYTVEVVQEYIDTNVLPSFRLIQHEVNNLAKAQNAGIRLAMSQGYNWVLLLDHDSIPDALMIEEMIRTHKQMTNPDELGMMIPNINDRYSIRHARYVRHRRQLLSWRSGFGKHTHLDDVLLSIASGSLIPVSTFRDVGMMDESLSIDMVDFDFSLRVVQAKRKIVAVRDAVLHHQLGKCRDHHILGACLTTSNHRPERRYTIYRNRLTLWRKHGMEVPAYLLFDGLAVLYDVFKIVALEANKREKLRAICNGLGDAVRGKLSASPFAIPPVPAIAGKHG